MSSHSNIWGPNRQYDIVKMLGKHYTFSPRLLAIMQTAPSEARPKNDHKHVNRFKAKLMHKDDVETASKSIDMPNGHSTPKPKEPPRATSHASHYSIAGQMINYQSIDVGAHCEWRLSLSG